MSANVSRPERLCTMRNGVNGTRKLKRCNNKIPNAIGRLNDFCLLQIFNFLDLTDLLNLTDINKQFKRMSEMSFAGRYAKLRYPDDVWYQTPRLSTTRRVICKFGKSIRTITYRDPWSDLAEFDTMTKFCAGGTLEELELTTKKMIKDDDCARLLFSSLKTLSLDYSEYNGYADGLFSECQQLKTLRLYRIPHRGLISDVAQKYRRLEELYIGDVNAATTRVLLRSNRQIKKLNMRGTYATTFAMLSKMVHLEELSIRRVSGVSSYNNIAQLAALNSLGVLELYDVGPQFVTAIVKAMEKVHSLHCFKCFGIYRDWEFTNQINKLKTLKSLALAVPPVLPLGTYFAELGGQFPLLHELELRFEYHEDSAASIGNLIRFIELSTTMEVLKIRTKRPKLFNQHFYDGLLKVISRRQSPNTFKVTVDCYELGSIALNMHSNLVQVEFNARGTNWFHR